MDELLDIANLDYIVWDFEILSTFPFRSPIKIPSLISYNGFICSEKDFLEGVNLLTSEGMIKDLLAKLAGLNPIRYNFSSIQILYSYALKGEYTSNKMNVGHIKFLRLLFVRDIVYYLKDRNKLSLLYYKEDKALTDTIDFILSRSYFSKENIFDTWRFTIGQLKQSETFRHYQYYISFDTIEKIKEGCEYYSDTNRNIRICSNNTREI